MDRFKMLRVAMLISAMSFWLMVSCGDSSSDPSGDLGPGQDLTTVTETSELPADGKPAATFCEVSLRNNQLAHSFMSANALIDEGDEQDLGFLKIRWVLTSVVEHLGGCLLVMNLCSEEEQTAEECWGLEVVVLEKDRVISFEEFFGLDPMALTMRAKFQLGVGYYFELTGPSVIAAKKAIAVDLRGIPAFSAHVVHGEKPPFDPTTGRSWKTIGAKYDLRRGDTAETLDIQATDLDHDFEAFFSGAIPGEIDGVKTAQVAPWGGVLAEVINDNGGLDLDEPEEYCAVGVNYQPELPPSDLTEEQRQACIAQSLFTLGTHAVVQFQDNTRAACIDAWCSAHLDANPGR